MPNCHELRFFNVRYDWSIHLEPTKAATVRRLRGRVSPTLWAFDDMGRGSQLECLRAMSIQGVVWFGSLQDVLGLIMKVNRTSKAMTSSCHIPAWWSDPRTTPKMCWIGVLEPEPRKPSANRHVKDVNRGRKDWPPDAKSEAAQGIQQPQRPELDPGVQLWMGTHGNPWEPYHQPHGLANFQVTALGSPSETFLCNNRSLQLPASSGPNKTQWVWFNNIQKQGCHWAIEKIENLYIRLYRQYTYIYI